MAQDAQITLKRPDDWHLHVRDGAILKAVLEASAREFSRAIIMPNLASPITTTDEALAYRTRILNALPPDKVGQFTPLMTLYLTDTLSASEVIRAQESGLVHAVKMYPAGATTHSTAGVTDITLTYETLACMQRIGMPLLIHGESTNSQVDIFDRELVFIEQTLIPLRQRFPELKIVFEHITTRAAVQYVQASASFTAATITVHHLLENRNALFQGGIRPHRYCLPILKRETDRQALLAAATSGDKRFFLGTDSAPHLRHDKESACGCAGLFTALSALPLYAEAFAEAEALHHLEGFASVHGPSFYGLPVNDEYITLKPQPWRIPASLVVPGAGEIIPYRAGETVRWQVNE